MNKKILAAVLALVMCLSCVSALAAPSKTTNNVVSTAPSGNIAEVVVTPPTAETQQTLAEIESAVASGTPIAECFGAEAASAIQAIAGDKTGSLKLNELVPVSSTGKIAGATSVTIRTAASYTQQDTIVVLAGVIINGKKVWKTLTYVVVNGNLVVTFPEDIAALLADGAVDLAILSDKAA